MALHLLPHSPPVSNDDARLCLEGVLTSEELKSEAAKLLRLLNKDLNGRVTFGEFEQYYERSCPV